MSRSNGVPDVASLTETQTIDLLDQNRTYYNYNLQLSNFQRAVNIAKSYQFYRIKRVTYIIRPQVDTFMAGSTTGAVPYLYWMIDRTRQLSQVDTAVKFRKLGAKPQRLDDKNLYITYRPSVLTSVFDSVPPANQSVAQFVSYKVSPWLSCRDNDPIAISVWNPDSTDHLGHIMFIENTGVESPWTMERVVEFEFKKPAIDLSKTNGAPEPVEIETLLLNDQEPSQSVV